MPTKNPAILIGLIALALLFSPVHAIKNYEAKLKVIQQKYPELEADFITYKKSYDEVMVRFREDREFLVKIYKEGEITIEEARKEYQMIISDSRAALKSRRDDFAKAVATFKKTTAENKVTETSKNSDVKVSTNPDRKPNVRDSKTWESYGYKVSNGEVYFGEQSLELDSESFQLVVGSSSLPADKNKILNKKRGRDSTEFTEIFGADPESFEQILYNNQATNYWRDKNAVFYENFGQYSVIEGLKSAEANPINRSLIRSNDSVYSQDKLIEGADAGSFEQTSIHTGSNLVARDKNSVFIPFGSEYTKAEGIDPESFEILKTPDGQFKNFIKDKTGVFHFRRGETTLIPELATDTVVNINKDFLKDKKLVVFYFPPNKFNAVEGAEPSSFEILNGDFVKDKNAVYKQNVTMFQKIETCNPEEVTSENVTKLCTTE